MFLSTRLRTLRLVLLCAVAALLVQGQARRPVSHKDFDDFRSISGQALSRDGRFLAYGFMPQDADGELVIRELATGKENRFGVGTMPQPPVTPADAEDQTPPPRVVRISFTSDGRFVVAGTYPLKADTRKARKEKKKAEEMPKPGLLIVNLATGEATRVADVKSFQVPEKGGSWLAYLKEAPPAKPVEAAKPAEAKPAGDDDADSDQRAAAGSAGGAKKEYGTELVLRDLNQPESAARSFASVSEYSFARDGKSLVYAVSSKKEDENGAFAVTPGADAAPAALASGKGKYSKLTWDRQQTELAFFFDKSAMLWDRKAAKATVVVTAATAGFPKDRIVSDKGALAFSRDGKRLYVPAGIERKEDAGESGAGEEKVLMDLWRSADDLVQPMQKIRANQERNRTWRGVWHIADAKYVQLATPEMQSVSLSDDGLRAVGYDDRAWRQRVDYDGSYSDAYVVDAQSGQRRSLGRGLRAGGFGGGGALQLSPDGQWAYCFNERAWWLVSLKDTSARNLTSALTVAFHDEDHDSPSAPGSYGAAGWAKDSQSFFVNDRYDVWQLFTDGRAPRCLTGGEGRRAKLEFRLQRTEPVDEEDDRGIDPAKPFTFRVESETTRETGFYRLAQAGQGTPQRLLWGAKNYRFVLHAKEADVLLITSTRFDEFPDLQQTDSNFTAPKRVSSGGEQLKPFLWGSSELIGFRSADGVALSAALYKPANFDPAKKYPLLVYIYEKLSQEVHNFIPPRPGTSINFSQYVSDGYVVLTPDIVYTIGAPGQSALRCVLPAIQAVVDKGFIDEARIGIQGHSWGGYQIAYMVTQTTRFRAAEAGAPVGNMTSAYSGIRWGSGMPRQFQYEKTQSRIGPPLYDDPLKYVENSPIFHIRAVRTPLLILHDDADDAVPWYQGIELFLALRRTGKEAYLLNYNGELHGLRRRHNQMDYAIRMKQFFDHFLKGAPAPDWMTRGVPFIEREEEKERFLKAAGQ